MTYHHRFKLLAIIFYYVFYYDHFHILAIQALVFLGKEERENGWTKRGKSAGRGWATKVRERWEERLSH